MHVHAFEARLKHGHRCAKKKLAYQRVANASVRDLFPYENDSSLPRCCSFFQPGEAHVLFFAMKKS